MTEPIPFDFSGDHLALDFANTLSGRGDGVLIERLTSYDRLLAFAEESGVAGEHADRWRAWHAEHPDEAAALVARVTDLREAMYRMFHAVASGDPPAGGDIEILNQWLARLCLGTDLEWHWCDGDDAPEAVLTPIIRAALDLITGERIGRVRVCEARDCQWVFLDQSRNRSRRWCDMATCGNREKARRHYERHHKG